MKAFLGLAALALLVGACASTRSQGTTPDESGDDDDTAETKPSSDDEPETEACFPGDPSDLKRVEAGAQIGNIGTAQRVEVGQEVYGVLKLLPYSDSYDLAYFIITVDEPTWVTITLSSSDDVTLGSWHDGVDCSSKPTPEQCTSVDAKADKDKPVSKSLKLWPGDTRLLLDARYPVKEAFYDLGFAPGCPPEDASK